MKIFTKNKRKQEPADIITAVKETDPSKIMVWMQDRDRMTVVDYMESVSPAAQAAMRQKTQFEQVEFIPADEANGVPGFHAWAAMNGVGGFTPDACARYLTETSANYGQELDANWERSRRGWTVFQCALSLVLSGEFGTFSQPTRFNLSVPEDVVLDLQHILESSFGEGNVFVSHQIVPVQTMYDAWRDFYDQSHARLVDGERYWLHKYDEQYHPARQLLVPAYAIPVGILVKWGRTVSREEYDAVLKRLAAPLLERMAFLRLVRRINLGFWCRGESLRTREGLLEDANRTRNMFLSACVDDIPEPQKEKATVGGRLRKIFGLCHQAEPR